MVKPQRGLSKAADLKNGQRTDPYCGSVEVVRSSRLLCFMTADSFFFRFCSGLGEEYSLVRTCSPIPSYDAHILDKLFDHREDQADARDKIIVNCVLLL